MVSQKIIINNPSGLHLRPAGILCNEAIKYSSAITFTFEGGTANAKSVLSVLGACVKCGDEIETLFSQIIKMRNRIIHSYRITNASGEQTLATKEKAEDGNTQFEITEGYLLCFIQLNQEDKVQ